MGCFNSLESLQEPEPEPEAEVEPEQHLLLASRMYATKACSERKGESIACVVRTLVSLWPIPEATLLGVPRGKSAALPASFEGQWKESFMGEAATLNYGKGGHRTKRPIPCCFSCSLIVRRKRNPLSKAGQGLSSLLVGKDSQSLPKKQPVRDL